MGERKPQFHLQSHGGKTQVVENATGLIWRTLDTRQEATNWMVLADPPPADRKKR